MNYYTLFLWHLRIILFIQKNSFSFLILPEESALVVILVVALAVALAEALAVALVVALVSAGIQTSFLFCLDQSNAAMLAHGFPYIFCPRKIWSSVFRRDIPPRTAKPLFSVPNARSQICLPRLYLCSCCLHRWQSTPCHLGWQNKWIWKLLWVTNNRCWGERPPSLLDTRTKNNLLYHCHH